MKTRFFVFALVMLWALPLVAQQPVPERAIAAEMAGQWPDAIAAYRDALARDPQRVDLWLRLADVHAQLKDFSSCADALAQASRLAPRDASILARLSQTYATAGQAGPARDAIDRALRLQPDNRDYLMAHAQLSTWAGEYRDAANAYQRVLALHPDDEQVWLPLARVSTWAGDTDQAVAMYRRYAARHGATADVLLDWARAESFRGNTAGALDRLAEYRKQFGETPRYVQEMAAVLARGGRPTEALALLRGLDSRASDADARATLNVLALAMQGRAREARDGLNALQQSGRATADTARLAPLLQSLFGATIVPGASTYSDSDGLHITTLAPRISVPVVPELRIDAGYQRDTMRAPAGPLGQENGRTDAAEEQVWGGVTSRIWPAVQLGARAGQARAEGRQIAIYQIDGTVRPWDGFQLQGSRDFNFLAISPRTLGLGLTRLTDRLGFSWMPGIQYFVDGQVSYQTFSDGNERWEFSLGPRRSVMRTDWLNLDIGASAYQMRTLLDLANGYYDPARYEFYAVTLFPYFKLGTNDGVGFTIAFGEQRATPHSTFQFGGNASIDAAFGIYRSWMIRVQGAATVNQRLETGAYRGVRATFALTRRF